MPRSRLVVAVFLATATIEAAAYVAPAGLPRAAIESCLGTLRGLGGGRSESGTFDLGERCPDLARELEHSLGEGDAEVVDTDAISVEGVRDLAAFAEGFRREPNELEDVELDFDGLDALLDEVLVEKISEDSLWDRFLRWLEQHVRKGESPRLGRFLDWLEGLEAPPWLGEVLIKVSTVLIVVLALIVVGNELRLSGILRRSRRKRDKATRPAVDAKAGTPRARSFDDLRGLPPRALAAAVLEIVIAAFAERGWLARTASLTNGELVAQLEERQSALAPPFCALVAGAERIVYGDRPPDEAARRRLIASAGALLARSRGESPAGTGARE